MVRSGVFYAQLAQKRPWQIPTLLRFVKYHKRQFVDCSDPFYSSTASEVCALANEVRVFHPTPFASA
jgi:hypothetical protein